MTEDEIKAIEARAARKYESDAEEDVIALAAEVRRLRDALAYERTKAALRSGVIQGDNPFAPALPLTPAQKAAFTHWCEHRMHRDADSYCVQCGAYLGTRLGCSVCNLKR